ncbi:hypothetical protein BGZ83_009252, partial [Gryganskiella cystojenkinii]
CKHYHHRDVMAADNMSRIARGYLEDQKRPLYLQPRTADGRYPWEGETSMTESSPGSSSASAGNISSVGGSVPSRGRKRTLPVSNTTTAAQKKTK